MGERIAQDLPQRVTVGSFQVILMRADVRVGFLGLPVAMKSC
jgi:hypothetical protein